MFYVTMKITGLYCYRSSTWRKIEEKQYYNLRSAGLQIRRTYIICLIVAGSLQINSDCVGFSTVQGGKKNPLLVPSIVVCFVSQDIKVT